jgi:hypothetical protein
MKNFSTIGNCKTCNDRARLINGLCQICRTWND